MKGADSRACRFGSCRGAGPRIPCRPTGYVPVMTPAPSDPDRVDPTNQSGRPVIGLIVVGVLALVLLTMVVVFVTST